MLFLEQNSGDVVSFANQRGYDYQPRLEVGLDLPSDDSNDLGIESIEPEESIVSAVAGQFLPEFWVPVLYSPVLSYPDTQTQLGELDPTVDTQVSLICDSQMRLPEVTYLACWPELRNRLEPLLSFPRRTRRVDTRELVHRMSRGDAIRKIPFLNSKRANDKITVIQDTSLRCVPYRLDQEMIVERLSRITVRGGLQVLQGESPFGLTKPERANETSPRFSLYGPAKNRESDPEPGSHVLILGDLGLLLKPGKQSDGQDIQAWYQACRRWSLMGCQIFTLVPFGSMRISPAFQRWVHPIAWQGNALDDMAYEQQEAALRTLLTIASPAQRVEPGLLREFRRQCPGLEDASIEALYWQDSRHSGPRPDAVKQPLNDARRAFLKRFEQLDPELIRQVLLWIRRYRITRGASVLWQTELMNLPMALRALIDPNQEDQQIASRSYKAFEWQLQKGGPFGIYDRLVSLGMAASEHAIEDPDIGPAVRKIRMECLPEEAPSDQARLDEVRPGDKTHNARIRGLADGLSISARDRSPTEPSPSGPNTEVALRSGKGLIELHGLSNGRHLLSEQAFWRSGTKPTWVSDYGKDPNGLWCEFQVPRRGGKGMVTQRMRWIQPGEFMMGSPEGEEGRWSDESPAHSVKLTQGYWMADSQVTQELWMAVGRGENPSDFKGESNPVENVSWEDCQAWFEKLREHHESLQPSLPTEAQWEHACRAGSPSAYCFGDDPRELPKYGWFGENTESKTHPVKQLQPNGWGLYDMHGNVWEWCSDWWGDYPASAQSDPTGPAKGTARVLRGGSWNYPARLLRSACRFRLDPGYRYNYLGFRLLSSALGAEPSERAMLPVAEQGTERARPVQVRVKDQETSRTDRFWRSGTKPTWVSDYGSDTYGLWCEFQVPRRDGDGMVAQRMRWIKPGEFLMGSPEGEEGRWDNESPQHPVKLTQGYWMADSQVAQELWMAVGRGKNPSNFKGESNPVENVSWEDCQAWFEKLRAHHESLQLSLPTEAQWEYACRAGSTSAYCFGDDPTELPKYGWFGENSERKTHPVKQLQPNGWGLYDMHGNVWEWCSDWRGDYDASAQTDPTGYRNGPLRVIRGGSWGIPARYLRSACRFRDAPGRRDLNLGFRLLSSALGAEPSERAMLPVAEQGTERARIGSAEFEYDFLCSVGLDATDPTRPEEDFSQIKFDKYSSICVVSDNEECRFDRLSKPTWAVDFGSDPYGVYATFEIMPEVSSGKKKGFSGWFNRDKSSPKPVRQCMRWIPPGRFFMGSSAGKDHERGNEGPQHEVIVSHGYWMFDTPCTQGLWTTLMGDNPSYFPDPERPVEQVSWEDAVRFAKKLNERLGRGEPSNRNGMTDGWERLLFRLPTEAEWEYACRAGTTGDTYAGDLDLKTNDQTKAEILDSIAWCGGNSGHKYDLEKSEKMTWLKDLQAEEKKGGTRKVAQKSPNSWGLYDMLGNVREWCQDWYGEYPAEPVERVVDPIGPTQGTARVIRGGGWNNPARYLRSACRHGYDPGTRYEILGFRLLSSAHQATESGEQV
jgi:formylglycine-generating enzyme required for sulfatase activity